MLRTVVKLPIGLVFLCAIALVTAQDKEECTTATGEEGVCVDLRKCYALRAQFTALADDSSQQLGATLNVEREKCSDDGSGEDLVCCKRKPPVQPQWTFVDAQPPLSDNLTQLLPNASVCGSYDSNRIFHGNVTDLGQYPWLAQVRYVRDGEETFDCGGSLINHRYVLTAAHCINSNILGVRLGEWDRNSDPDCVIEDGETVCAPPVLDVGIDKIMIHKNYTRKSSQGGKVDMALIRMDQSVSFNEYMHPVCVPIVDAEAAIKKTLYVSGWGLTENYTPTDKKLFTVLNYVEHQQCKDEINNDFIKVDDTVICARGSQGRDACWGDSGGPLMHIGVLKLGKYNVARLFLSGVISRGLSCGSTKPSFYTSTYKQINWILSNMEP